MPKICIQYKDLEQTIFKHLCDGLILKEIAREMKLPTRRIFYLCQLLQKEYDAKNIHHLVYILTKKQYSENGIK